MRLSLCFVSTVFLFSCSILDAQVPTSINYQGRLVDTNGIPVNGAVDVDVAIYDQSSGGTQWYSEDIGSVAVVGGLYSFAYGTNQFNLALALNQDEAWLEVIIDSEPLSPRQRLLSVPYALYAGATIGGDPQVQLNGSTNLSYMPSFGSFSKVLSVEFPASFSTPPVLTTSLLTPPNIIASAQVIEKTTNGFTVILHASSINDSFKTRPTDLYYGVADHVYANLVNGKPALVLDNGASWETGYIQSQNAQGTSWNAFTNMVPEAPGTFLIPAGIFNADGHPGVLLKPNVGAGDIVYFQRALDPDGFAWPSSSNSLKQFLLSDTGAVYTVCPQSIHGKPAMAYNAYVDGDPENPFFIIASNQTGTAWHTPAPIPLTPHILAEANGHPAVIGRKRYHLDDNSNTVFFSRALDPEGASWPVETNLVTVFQSNTTNYNLSIQNNSLIYLPGGNLGFLSMHDNALYFISSSSPDGSAWNTPIKVIDPSTNAHVGSYYSKATMEIIDGRPAVCHIMDGTLYFVHAQDAAGTLWPDKVYVDTTPLREKGFDLIDVHGIPGIAYTSGTNLFFTTQSLSNSVDVTLDWIAVE